MGVVVKDEWNQRWCGVGGLVVSLPTDQITAGISSSVSIRSKEVNPLGSIWEKSVTTLMDMQHLHLNVRTFCLSIQLNGDEQCGPQ